MAAAAALTQAAIERRANWAFAVAWPSSWFVLIAMGLSGAYIDYKYRKEEHEVMRFRWESWKLAFMGERTLQLRHRTTTTRHHTSYADHAPYL